MRLDRGDAVNLATNYLADHNRGITDKGIQTLANAVLAMDKWIKAQHSDVARSSVIEECAVLCDAYAQISSGEADTARVNGDKAHWERGAEQAAQELARDIRSLKDAAPQAVDSVTGPGLPGRPVGAAPVRAEWDGTLAINSDTVINGVLIKAGTVLRFNTRYNSPEPSSQGGK